MGGVYTFILGGGVEQSTIAVNLEIFRVLMYPLGADYISRVASDSEKGLVAAIQLVADAVGNRPAAVDVHGKGVFIAPVIPNRPGGMSGGGHIGPAAGGICGCVAVGRRWCVASCPKLAVGS